MTRHCSPSGAADFNAYGSCRPPKGDAGLQDMGVWMSRFVADFLVSGSRRSSFRRLLKLPEASGDIPEASGGSGLQAPGDPGSSPGRSQGGAKILNFRPFRRPFWRPFWRPPVNRMAPKTWIFRGFGGLFWSSFWTFFGAEKWLSKAAF